MANFFDGASVDQLHTLATALGNAVKNIDKSRSAYPATAEYMDICIEDAEALLVLINQAFERKRT